MTGKFWLRSDDWYRYAPCFGIRDFTVPPQRSDDGPTSDPQLVEGICESCRVRPECAKAACDEEWHDVWVCGVWIPGHDVDRKEANTLRDMLSRSVDEEFNKRGEDV